MTPTTGSHHKPNLITSSTERAFYHRHINVYASFRNGPVICLLFQVLKELFIVLQGSNINQKYLYIVLGSVAILATIATAFLPETLNRKLPDNIQDAKYFGRNQKFWSFFHTFSADTQDSCLN